MPLTAPPLLKSFLKKELPNVSPSDINKELDIFFGCKVLGINAISDDSPLYSTFKYYLKWEDITQTLWEGLCAEERNINETIKFLCESLFDIDDSIFIENNNINRIENKVAGIAAMITAKNLLMAYLEQAQENETDTTQKNTDNATILIMFIAIMVGTIKDGHEVFFYMMNKPIQVYGFDPKQADHYKKNPIASRLMHKTIGKSFHDTFRSSLSTVIRTGNSVIDIIYNDKIKYFIVNL